MNKTTKCELTRVSNTIMRNFKKEYQNKKSILLFFNNGGRVPGMSDKSKTFVLDHIDDVMSFIEQSQKNKEEIARLDELTSKYLVTSKTRKEREIEEEKKRLYGCWGESIMDKIEEIAEQKYPKMSYWCDTGSRWNVCMAMLDQFKRDL